MIVSHRSYKLQRSDSLPPVDQLYASLATYYEQKTEAELAEFQETKKGEWLKYIPSVGVTYTYFR